MLSLKGKNFELIDDTITTPIPGIFYKKTGPAILPEILEDIFNDRKKFKQQMKEEKKKGNLVLAEQYNIQQYTRKILINSIYGVLANEFFHFYNVDNARAVTAGGRDLIKFLAENINKYLKYKYKLNNDCVILVDTDSCYICLDELMTSLGETNVLEFGNKIHSDVFKPFFKNILEIYAERFNIPQLINFQRDKIISQILILAKKKYAAIVLDKEGYTYEKKEIDITGIEIVRTSTPSFCRDKIFSIIEKIFETMNKNTILDLLKDIKKNFLKSPIEDISFPRGVSDYEKYCKGDSEDIKKGTPIHIRASMNYNNLLEKHKIKSQPITSGTKMKFCYVTTRNELNTNIIGFVGNCPDKIKESFQIDYETQWRKSFQDVVERFFVVLGWDEINLTNNKLNKFFE